MPCAVKNRRGVSGFTLIELMLVVSIIGLLAAIAIPKFANMVTKAKEAAVKGKLGSLRSAVSLYYANNEGMYPGCYSVTFGSYCLPVVLIPRYIGEIPEAAPPTATEHIPNRGVRFGEPTGPAGYSVVPEGMAFIGAHATWYYQMVPWFGFYDGERVQVNCTHLDSTGVSWSLH